MTANLMRALLLSSVLVALLGSRASAQNSAGCTNKIDGLSDGEVVADVLCEGGLAKVGTANVASAEEVLRMSVTPGSEFGKAQGSIVLRVEGPGDVSYDVVSGITFLWY